MSSGGQIFVSLDTGRVFRNQPAPTNLEVPPYQWLSDTRVLIGDDGRGEV